MQPPDDSFFWCADIQRELAECLYVDAHHYSAKFSKQFAEEILQRCRDRGVLKQVLSN